MYKSKFKNVVLLCLLAVSIEVMADKPFRPSPIVLIDEATIIVKGDVLDIYPSLMKNHLGNPLGVAKVRVKKIYKGNVPNNIYVVTNYDKTDKTFDENGKSVRHTSIWEYFVSSNDKDVLFFLNKKDHLKKSDVYFPIQNFSGLVHIGKSPYYLEKVVEVFPNN